MANRYGKNIVDVMLSDGQTLPSTTSEDSTNMAFVGGKTGGKLRCAVYAKTAISIATGQLLYIELQAYSADTAASATSPFSTANKGAQANIGSGTLEDNAHMYLLHKTTADGQLDFAAGDLIADIGLPEDNLALLSYDYVQLRYETDANESSETVDAFIYERG